MNKKIGNFSKAFFVLIFFYGFSLTAEHAFAATSTPDVPVILYPDSTPFIATSTPLLASGTSTADTTIVVTYGSSSSTASVDSSGNWSISLPLTSNATTTFVFLTQSGTTTSGTTGIDVFLNDQSSNNSSGGGNSSSPSSSSSSHHGSGDRARPVETTAGIYDPVTQTLTPINSSTQISSTVGTIPITGQVLGASTQAMINSNLTVGSRGTEVLILQQRLFTLGFLKVNPTGYFGTSTKSAVMSFQKSLGIKATGFFGPITRGVFNS